MNAEELIGTWRLRSWKSFAGDGSEIDQLGQDPVGYIIYTGDGYVSVDMMASHREREGSGDTPPMSAYLAYAGPFEVLADQDTVIHHVEVCSIPDWVGTAQVRSAKLEGDRLTLSFEPMIIQGVERRGELVWERPRAPGRQGT